MASIPYRNSDTGTSQTLTISVYEMSLPLAAGKTVASADREQGRYRKGAPRRVW